MLDNFEWSNCGLDERDMEMVDVFDMVEDEIVVLVFDMVEDEIVLVAVSFVA